MPSAEMSLRQRRSRIKGENAAGDHARPKEASATSNNKLGLVSQTAKGDKGLGPISPLLLPKC